MMYYNVIVKGEDIQRLAVEAIPLASSVNLDYIDNKDPWKRKKLDVGIRKALVFSSKQPSRCTIQDHESPEPHYQICIESTGATITLFIWIRLTPENFEKLEVPQ